ncbi:glycerol uptake facilitator-like aquaporin [Microcella alkaliphila]|uniref:Glycerol uptake facilitator-like aquaporin n=1 Tax=Microcella alkaliphila TaxID=279828 RepID=A0A4Q7TNR7_9MICO|nr:MIP/aquaporin family protein [Microcella alkaliphila]RZT62273.1 glycerol uptake facilitator-like aquaporin [Microcella alkaliphila]
MSATTAAPPLPRRLVAEFTGSALLAAIVVGSGIMATSLTPDVGVQLLINAVATAFGLTVLILVFGPVGGAHFNPAVTLAIAATRGLAWRDAPAYITVQIAGCSAGAVLANLMFAEPAISVSTTDRVAPNTLVAEVVAAAGLVLVILALVRSQRLALVAPAVGAYIGSAYFFTASTSFANPAITIGRMLSDTFAGIAPTSVPGFVIAQLVGAALGLTLAVLLYPRRVDIVEESRSEAGAGSNTGSASTPAVVEPGVGAAPPR